MGNSGFKKKLKKLEDAGYDIRNSTDWVNAFDTTETRNYMKFVGLGQDGSGDLTIEDMNKKIEVPKYQEGPQRLVLRKTGGVIEGKSGIHIKPENRGKLTRLKKRTGKSEAELWKTGSPAVRKMITFARNSRKWKKK